jgi:hypothetical protein
MSVLQTIQFDTVSPSEIGSGTITAFLFSGTTLSATLASIAENGTLKGRHTGTVTDIAAGDYRLVVKFDGYTVSEPDESVTLLLAVGTYVSKRLAELDSAVATKIDNIQDAAGWLLAISSGAVANPQTSTEQYDITQFGVNYRVAMAGLTSTGTRTAPTLSKP